jgi:hypothetical protein
MKPRSVILAFIGLTVIGVLIAGCFVRKPLALSKDVLFCIEIGDPTQNKYVLLQDQSENGKNKFKGKVGDAEHHGGKCENVTFKQTDNSTPESLCARAVNLKTDRVIKSELASNRDQDSSAANDPNVTWRISSQDPKDITDIALLLKP